jgi:hypothetical protein
MDPTRFDAAAKQFAAPGSRRRVLAALVAAALGLAGRDRAEAVVCRTPGLLCRQNADCCAHLCAADAAGRRTCRCRTQADCPPPTNRCLATTCAAGACGTTPAVHCPPPDQCHDVGTCDTSTGQCSNPPKTDGTACTPLGGGNGTCQGGTCVAPTTTTTTTTPLPCLSGGACCPDGTCCGADEQTCAARCCHFAFYPTDPHCPSGGSCTCFAQGTDVHVFQDGCATCCSGCQPSTTVCA